MKKFDLSRVVSLEQHRRTRRAAIFIAQTMSAAAMELVEDEIGRGTYTRHLPEIGFDLSVGRDKEPSAAKMLTWARSRAKNLVFVHLRDAQKPVAGATLHIVLVDGGTAFFPGYHLFRGQAAPGRPQWWFVNPGNPVLLRLGRQGPVPTVDEPFSSGAERDHGILMAERELADVIWRVRSGRESAL